jgi:hypothetical protein
MPIRTTGGLSTEEPWAYIVSISMLLGLAYFSFCFSWLSFPDDISSPLFRCSPEGRLRV